IPMRLEKRLHEDEADMPRDYGRDGMHAIRHETGLCMMFAGDQRILHGDSGSPVSTARDGGQLVGMVFAVNYDRDPTSPISTEDRAYAIPVWEVLDPANYGLHQREETWTVLAPGAS